VCGQQNGSRELGDAFYLWPEGLAHYVTDHDVRLPDEFVVHVASFSASQSPLVVERVAPLDLVLPGQSELEASMLADGQDPEYVAELVSDLRFERWLHESVDETWWFRATAP
jgi:hypothetical protein